MLRAVAKPNPWDSAVLSGCSLLTTVHTESTPVGVDVDARVNLKRRSPGQIGVAWTGFQTANEAEANKPMAFQVFDGLHEASASLSGEGVMAARYARNAQRARFFIA